MTPLTDAATFDIQVIGDAYTERISYPDGAGDLVDADFARSLERKLAAAREAIEKAPHADDCANEYVMTLRDGVYGDQHRCTCWKSAALASIENSSPQTTEKPNHQ